MRAPLSRALFVALPVAAFLSTSLPAGVGAQPVPDPVFPADGAWVPLKKSQVVITDPTTDGQNNGKNLVGTDLLPAAYYARDANHFFFRIRVDDSPLDNSNNFGKSAWACGIDINPTTTVGANLYEFLVMVNAKNNTGKVEYQFNSVPGSQPNPVAEVAETVVASYGTTASPNPGVYARTQPAGSSLNTTPDFFIDWAVPISVMTNPPSPVGGFTIPPVDFSKPLAFFCGTSASGNSLNGDRADNGTNTTDLGQLISDPGICSGTSCSSCTINTACGVACSDCTLTANPVCDPGTGTCVGCLGNLDCGAAGASKCKLASHQCVQCLVADDCGLAGVDCVADACVIPAPTVTTPSDGANLTANPVVTGTTLLGTSVTVTIVDFANPANVLSQGAAVVTGTSFTYTPVPALGTGSYTVFATASATVGGASTTSAASAANDFTVQIGCSGPGTCTTTPSTPICVGSVCVQCDGNPDCPTGATCASNSCSLAAPTISAPTDGATINDPTPAITGTTVAGTSVIVTIKDNLGNEVTSGPAVVNGTSWSFSPSLSLTPGDFTITAVATSTSTFTVSSAPSSPVDFTLISGCLVAGDCPPSTPHCDGSNACVRCLIADDCPTTTPGTTCVAGSCVLPSPTITAPVNNSIDNDTTPTFTGTAPDGTTVTIRIDNVVVATDVPVTSGTWTFTPVTPVSTADHTVLATAVAGSGPTAVSSNSELVNFTVVAGCLDAGDCGGATPFCRTSDGQCVRCLIADDCPTTTPATTCVSNACVLTAPTITAPTQGATINDATPTITGTAPDGTTVTLTINGNVVQTGIPVSGGTWSFTPSNDLTPGTYTISAVAVAGSGPTAVTSSSSPTVDFTLITGCLQSGECSTPTPVCEPVSHTCVECVDHTDCTGGKVCVGLACVSNAPTITSPLDGATTGLQPTITGTAPPGSTVTVFVDGDEVGTTTADSNGAWSFPLPDPLSVGDHTIGATATVGMGSASVTSGQVTISITAAALADDLGTVPSDLGTSSADLAVDGGVVAAPDLAQPSSDLSVTKSYYVELAGGGFGCAAAGDSTELAGSALLLLVAFLVVRRPRAPVPVRTRPRKPLR